MRIYATPQDHLEATDERTGSLEAAARSGSTVSGRRGGDTSWQSATTDSPGIESG